MHTFCAVLHTTCEQSKQTLTPSPLTTQASIAAHTSPSSGSDPVQLAISPLPLSYQTTNSLLKQDHPTLCPTPYLSSLTLIPRVQFLGVNSEGSISRKLQVNLGQTVVFKKAGPHTVCSLLMPSHPTGFFFFSKMLSLSLFLSLKGNATEPVCDYSPEFPSFYVSSCLRGTHKHPTARRRGGCGQLCTIKRIQLGYA